METVFSKEVRPLLDLIDTLREIGLQNEISLPQICVMGDQSSGKSSVLQAISGIPFPRGSGLVTRCPTELIMNKSKQGSEWRAEISVSGNHTQAPPDKVVYNIEDLPPLMTELVNMLTGNDMNGFSTDRIIIKITSPESPDLTLIDLPGIVRTSTMGQNIGVISQVNNLIDSYIKLSNTIILAVIPCNQDIATVDILERATQVDPQGLRTIGVLTKPDLIGPGNEEEVVKVLLNQTKPLKLGYIMVKNSSQKQMNEGQSIGDARSYELDFFANHPYFSQYIEKNLFGVNNLIISLTKLLVSCIKRAIPGMIQEIKRILTECKEELSQLGHDLPSEVRDQQALVVQKVSDYCQVINLTSRGEYRDKGGLLVKDESYRLHTQVQTSFRKLQVRQPLFSDCTRIILFQEQIIEMRPVTGHSSLFDNLEAELIAQRGRELPGFINSQVFYAQIIQLVEGWRPIVEQCKAEVVQCTLNISSLISYRLIKEFPELCNSVQSIANHLIEVTAEDVSSKLEALLLREQNPFTTQEVLLEVVNGIRFRTFEMVLRQILDTTDAKSLGEDMNSLREDIRQRLGAWYMQRHGVDAKGNEQEMITLIQAYWDIASRRLIDNVCMCLDMEFSNKFVRELEMQCVLFGISLSETSIKELLQEDLMISQRRKRFSDRVERLQQSLTVLDRVTSNLNEQTIIE